MNVVVDQQGHMTGSLVPANPWKRVRCCAGTAIRNPYPYLSVPVTRYPRCYPYPCHSLCRWCLASHLLIQLVYQYDSSEPTISFLKNTIKHSLAGSCSSVDPSCFTWQNLPPSPSRGLQLAFGQSFTNSAGSSV